MSKASGEAPFPIQCGLYLLNTSDLSTIQHGCYFLLMLHYWENGPLEPRVSSLAAICKMSTEAFADTALDKMRRFFKKDEADGLLHNKKLDEVRAKRDKIKVPKPTRVTADGPEFDAFWHAYPKKVGRGAALKAFLSASKRAEIPAIMAGLARFIKNLPREMQFVPHASTWLNQDRWTDEQRRPDASPAPHGAPSPRTGGISQDEAARLGL